MRNIQCKKCFFFTPEWCSKKRDSLDPDLIRDCQYYRTKTNGDKIRAMEDEELSKLISGDWCEIVCPGNSLYCYGDCDKNILEWLKQEAE